MSVAASARRPADPILDPRSGASAASSPGLDPGDPAFAGEPPFEPAGARPQEGGSPTFVQDSSGERLAETVVAGLIVGALAAKQCVRGVLKTADNIEIRSAYNKFEISREKFARILNSILDTGNLAQLDDLQKAWGGYKDALVHMRILLRDRKRPSPPTLPKNRNTRSRWCACGNFWGNSNAPPQNEDLRIQLARGVMKLLKGSCADIEGLRVLRTRCLELNFTLKRGMMEDIFCTVPSDLIELEIKLRF